MTEPTGEPRTEATGGQNRWTLTGPIRLEVDPQSGQTHIYYEAASAPSLVPPDEARRAYSAATAFVLIDAMDRGPRVTMDEAESGTSGDTDDSR